MIEVEEEVLVYTFFHDLKEAYKVYGFFKDSEVYADRVVVKTVWYKLFQITEKYVVGVVLDRNDYKGIDKVRTLFKENFNIKASVNIINCPEEVRKMGNEVNIKEFESQLMSVVKELEDVKSSLDKINVLSKGLLELDEENKDYTSKVSGDIHFLTKDLAYDISRMSTYWSRAFESDAKELENLCKQYKELG